MNYLEEERLARHRQENIVHPRMTQIISHGNSLYGLDIDGGMWIRQGASSTGWWTKLSDERRT